MSGLLFLIITGVLSLITVAFFAASVRKASPGNERMQDLMEQIQEGASAFLSREYKTVAVVIVIIAGALIPTLGVMTAASFALGAVVSMLAGLIGMRIATQANARTAHAAQDGLAGAFRVAVSGGAVMGLGVVGLALLGLALVIGVLVKGVIDVETVPIINGFAMGASLMALFARSGGGIYTKAADMGADLVGKVEAGIPEDDPRNPAVIADNVGDNVGDVAGLGADLLESYVESMIASMAIAAAIGVGMGDANLIWLPLYIGAAGAVASILGVFWTRMRAGSDAQGALMSGTYVAMILSAAATWFLVSRFGGEYVAAGKTYGAMGPFWATICGIASGALVGYVSEYFTSGKFKPVKRLAENSQSGPAITVTEGIAVGMESTAVPVIVLAAAVLGAYELAGMYGVAMAAVGMLSTAGMIVAVDSYGPIADNAGGIAEMAHLDPKVREITDNLDAVGNTTAAIGKGFAIGSAAFAALALLAAFLETAQINPADLALNKPKVMAGLLIGGMLPFYFSSQLFRAVSSAAYKMIAEVRRQFDEIPGLREGKPEAKPDSRTCVDISTAGAIRGMMVPGLMAILVPVVVGFVPGLGAETLAGLLIGALVTGVMLGIQTANSGGAMDNAKKYIEEGHFGGKNSEAHKAAVVGDTVGDPLKDTVGPSINILIKLMAVISLVIAPLL